MMMLEANMHQAVRIFFSAALAFTLTLTPTALALTPTLTLALAGAHRLLDRAQPRLRRRRLPL